MGSTGASMVWDSALDAWRVLEYRTAEACLLDPHFAPVPHVRELSLPGQGVPSPEQFFESWFSWSPYHRQVKRLLHRAYADRHLTRLAPSLDRIAEDESTKLASQGNLVTSFIQPFTLLCTAEAASIPLSEQRRLSAAVAVLTSSLRAPRYTDRGRRALEACIRYLRSLLETMFHLEHPGPTVEALRAVAQSEELGIWHAVSVLAQLLAGGVEPTVAAVGTACLHLVSETPIHALGSQRVDMLGVADEVVRLRPPFPRMHRWVQQDCECLNMPLTRGTHIVIDLAAVNRDPAVFDRPDEFRPERESGAGLAFGHGIHHCLGAGLARLQVAAGLRALVALDPPLEIDSVRAVADWSGHIAAVPMVPFRRGAP